MKSLILFSFLFSLSSQAASDSLVKAANDGLTKAASGHNATAWDLNDVSYLMPLPTKADSNALLSINTPAKGGALIEESLIERLPPLAIDRSREEALQALRAMAVRIDPCFPLPTPQSCQRQIRLVWQPLEQGRRGHVSSVDAALHSFYILTDTEFENLLSDLMAWKKKYSISTRYLPLQVHPAFSEQLEFSPSLQDFNEIIVKYAGHANLFRVTSMVLRGAGDMWAFAAFDKHEDTLRLTPVARLNGRLSQAFINLSVPADHFAGGGITPLPSGKDTLNRMTKDELLNEDAEDIIRQEIKSAYRIENPHNYNPENMDCVSCHVAQPAIHWALNKKKHLKLDQLWNSEIYKNPKYNLSNQSFTQWNTQIIRGMGYFGSQIALSQRVINESAEVADHINLMTMKKKK